MNDVVRWVYGQGGAEPDRITRDSWTQHGNAAEWTDAQAGLRRPPRLLPARRARRAARSKEPRRSCLPPIACRPSYGPPPRARSRASGCSPPGNRVPDLSNARRSKLLRPILIALLTELLDHAYETANNSSDRRLKFPSRLSGRARQRRPAPVRFGKCWRSSRWSRPNSLLVPAYVDFVPGSTSGGP